MTHTPVFRRLPGPDREKVVLTVDGHPIEALKGDSVAAAVLAAGVVSTRTTPVSGSARAPYCLMGVCFECLMDIDGEPNSQACMTLVRDGMVVRSQAGERLPAGQPRGGA